MIVIGIERLITAPLSDPNIEEEYMWSRKKCDKCEKIVSKSNFARHKKKCNAENEGQALRWVFEKRMPRFF